MRGGPQVGGQLGVAPHLVDGVFPLLRRGPGQAGPDGDAADLDVLGGGVVAGLPAGVLGRIQLQAVVVPPLHAQVDPLVAVLRRRVHHLLEGPLGAGGGHERQPGHGARLLSPVSLAGRPAGRGRPVRAGAPAHRTTQGAGENRGAVPSVALPEAVSPGAAAAGVSLRALWLYRTGRHRRKGKRIDSTISAHASHPAPAGRGGRLARAGRRRRRRPRRPRPRPGPARTVRFRWGAGGEGGGRELQPALLYSGAALAVLLLVALALVAGSRAPGAGGHPRHRSHPRGGPAGRPDGGPRPGPGRRGGATRRRGGPAPDAAPAAPAGPAVSDAARARAVDLLGRPPRSARPGAWDRPST